ncbi:SDR family NAD(P)-dependent oxidoreductase [Luteipulveratus halotolerans]|uniref:Ketoreductase domain-containing protein n=1 Tax=Luteipulveratus halotolerans TaxID=1631356 RepID=A0A0L6CNG9_9MICO|nr:SDR family oxidoreductase [Luteipulveratus halotolerans]KNX39299.1 hypothetical protein VV01_07970 [Luteipulveratus halotolerans]
MSDSVIVITGAGSGIGRSTALALARGPHRLALVGRREDRLAAVAARIGSLAPDSVAPTTHSCDLANPVAVQHLSDSLTEVRVAGLVLAAGGVAQAPLDGTLGAIAHAWIDQLQLNLMTAVLVTEALSDRLADPSAIVAIGSIAGTRGGGSYGAAKAALVPWIRDLARTLGPRGVTANVVAPGYVADTEFFGSSMTPERHERLIGETYDGRPAAPDEVAALIRLLVSEHGRHISGQVLHVNGGALLAG